MTTQSETDESSDAESHEWVVDSFDLLEQADIGPVTIDAFDPQYPLRDRLRRGVERLVPWLPDPSKELQVTVEANAESQVVNFRNGVPLTAVDSGWLWIPVTNARLPCVSDPVDALVVDGREDDGLVVAYYPIEATGEGAVLWWQPFGGLHQLDYVSPPTADLHAFIRAQIEGTILYDGGL